MFSSTVEHSQPKSLFSENFQTFFILLLAVSGIRVVLLAFNHMPLTLDEAQYWIWSRHLSWGYHSKPPMIAGVIALTTSFFGDGFFGTRLSSVIVNGVTSLFVFFCGKELFSDKVGFWSGLTYLFLPLVTVSSGLISTDPLMLMFWYIAFYCLILTLKNSKIYLWLLIGFFIGCSVLAKYPGIFFFAFLAFYLYIDPKKRYLLKKPQLYIAFLITLIIVLPNLNWISQNEWVTFKHIFSNNLKNRFAHNPLKLVGFFVPQFILFSAILFYIFLSILFKKETWDNSEKKLLLSFSLPLLMILLLIALFIPLPLPHYLFPAYGVLVIFVVQFLIEHHPNLIKVNIFISLVLSIFIYAFTLRPHSIYEFSSSTTNKRYYLSFLNSNSSGVHIQKFIKAYPDTDWLFDSRAGWMLAIYYAKLPIERAFAWRAEDDFGKDTLEPLKTQKGKDFIFLSEHSKLPIRLTQSFFNHYALGNIDHTYPHLYIYFLENYRGG